MAPLVCPQARIFLQRRVDDENTFIIINNNIKRRCRCHSHLRPKGFSFLLLAGVVMGAVVEDRSGSTRPWAGRIHGGRPTCWWNRGE
jgi:hypothetical protein